MVRTKHPKCPVPECPGVNGERFRRGEDCPGCHRLFRLPVQKDITLRNHRSQGLSLPVIRPSCRHEGRIIEYCAQGNVNRNVHECEHPSEKHDLCSRLHPLTRYQNCAICPDYEWDFSGLPERFFLRGVRDPIPDSYPTSTDPERHITALHWLAKQEYAPPPITGDGAVFCAEGRYWRLCVESIRCLRASGFEGMIQVWHRPSAGGVAPEDVEGMGVQLIDAEYLALLGGDQRVSGEHNGWSSKLYALTHAMFERVLFLDADAFVQRDIRSLFDRAQPLAIWGKPHQNIRWREVGFPQRPNTWSHDFQGGQFVINRKRAWKEIVLAHWMCQHRDYFFDPSVNWKDWVLYGDEDALKVAFDLTKQSAHLIDVGDYEKGWGIRFYESDILTVDHVFDAKWQDDVHGPLTRMSFTRQMRSFQPPISPPSSGQGIVIAAGGSYWPGAYVCVRMLRHYGCTLPIQIWYLGARDEYDERYVRLLKPYAVTCIDADQHPNRKSRRSLDGYQMKLFAVRNSSFQEVLSIDADVYPCQNPTCLFECPRYQESGAIYYPDFSHSHGRTKWRAFEMEAPEKVIEWETGIYLVNRAKCDDILALAEWIDDHSDYAYHHGLGDTVSHLVAWTYHNRQPTLYRDSPEWKCPAILQVGPDGHVLWVHRCGSKFSIDRMIFTGSQQMGVNVRGGLPSEDLAFSFFAELVNLLR
jgi:Mannosyltransferase putative